MERNNFIETREDVVQNIKTLYSYLNDKSNDSTYQWATGIFKNGRTYVIEIVDSNLRFAPSRFVGYKDNSIKKHQEDPGNGNLTNEVLSELYQKEDDERLEQLFQKELARYDLSTTSKKRKYWIPDNITVEDILKYAHNTNDSLNRDSFINQCVELLQIKKNIILQGAPGTGKTYNTAAIALKILGINDVDFSNHSAIMERYKSLIDSQIFFTSFHQSLDYEDFVEGMKPRIQTDSDGNSVGVTYEPEDGIFKLACQAVTNDESKDIVECIDDYLQTIKGFRNKKKIPTITGRSSFYAWWEEGNTTISTRSIKNQREDSYTPSPLNIAKIKLQAQGKGVENNWPQYAQAFIEAVKEENEAKANKPVVLIIDEINRGNISKIFGELITLLEADKRVNGEHPLTAILPYSKTLFGVPSNLYIIGTMNTTDRSTGTLDYALRRRFAFVTLKSDVSIVANYYDSLGDADFKNTPVALFNDIRDFIDNPKHICGDLDIDDLMVGHSYFMAKSKEELSYKIRYEVIPLINEYINDGILNVKVEEKKQAFEAWSDMKTIPQINDEDIEEE